MGWHLCSKSWLGCALFLCCGGVIAQTITVVPSNPTADQPVSATLSQPFDCSAPQPALSAHNATLFAFDSVLPSGIVNCGAIPVPPPTSSNFTIDLGTLAAGSYTVDWRIYLDQAPNPPLLQSSATATFIVTASTSAPGQPNPAATPALPAWAMLGLGAACLLMGMRGLKQRSH